VHRAFHRGSDDEARVASRVDGDGEDGRGEGVAVEEVEGRGREQLDGAFDIGYEYAGSERAAIPCWSDPIIAQGQTETHLLNKPTVGSQFLAGSDPGETDKTFVGNLIVLEILSGSAIFTTIVSSLSSSGAGAIATLFILVVKNSSTTSLRSSTSFGSSSPSTSYWSEHSRLNAASVSV
jgi:hypothetical protein